MKPTIKLSGQDGNIFNLLGLASNKLKAVGQHDQAKEMSDKVMKQKSYEEALGVIMEYCDVE